MTAKDDNGGKRNHNDGKDDNKPASTPAPTVATAPTRATTNSYQLSQMLVRNIYTFPIECDMFSSICD